MPKSIYGGNKGMGGTRVNHDQNKVMQNKVFERQPLKSVTKK